MDSSIANTAYASILFIALSTVPSIRRLTKTLRQVKPPNDTALYEDEDGVATEESMAKYSTKYSFTVIFGATSLGLAIAFGAAIFASVARENPLSDLCVTQLWLLSAAWVRKSVRCHPRGLADSWSEDLHASATPGYSKREGHYRQVPTRCFQLGIVLLHCTSRLDRLPWTGAMDS